MSEILIVDDERTIRRSLAALLRSEGYSVREARGGEEALSLIAEARPDLVLLDVMMPGMNGYAVCGAIRRRDPLLPVVFLTAKDDDVAELRGFGQGCDDYISKSTSDELILARLRRVLERAASPSPRPRNDVIRIGVLTADLHRLAVMQGAEEVAQLTESEADILALLDSDRGCPFSSDEIIAELRGAGFACEDSMVYTHVARLRRKLGDEAVRIVCSRGSGYRLTD